MHMARQPADRSQMLRLCDVTELLATVGEVVGSVGGIVVLLLCVLCGLRVWRRRQSADARVPREVHITSTSASAELGAEAEVVVQKDASSTEAAGRWTSATGVALEMHQYT